MQNTPSKVRTAVKIFKKDFTIRNGYVNTRGSLETKIGDKVISANINITGKQELFSDIEEAFKNGKGAVLADLESYMIPEGFVSKKDNKEKKILKFHPSSKLHLITKNYKFEPYLNISGYVSKSGITTETKKVNGEEKTRRIFNLVISAKNREDKSIYYEIPVVLNNNETELKIDQLVQIKGRAIVSKLKKNSKYPEFTIAAKEIKPLELNQTQEQETKEEPKHQEEYENPFPS